MAKKNKKLPKNSIFQFEKKEIGLFFLGVGLTMFLINITTYIQLLPYLNLMKFVGFSPMIGYYTSITSSIILMFYSVYNIYNEE